MGEVTSIRQAAKWLGVHHKTAANHTRHKRFPLKREPPWNLDEMNEWRIWKDVGLQPDRSSPDRQLVEPPADEQDKDYWLMRKYRAQALQQEGKLVDTDAVMRAWIQTSGDIRDQVLLLPAAVQGLLSLTDEQTKQLDGFTRQLLAGIADRVVDLADAAQAVPGGSQSDAATDAAEPEPVGGGSPVHAPEHDGEPRPVEE